MLKNWLLPASSLLRSKTRIIFSLEPVTNKFPSVEKLTLFTI